MIDFIKGLGTLQNVLSLNKAQGTNAAKRENEAVERKDNAAPADEVSISAEASEALSLSQVEQATQDVRSALENNAGVTLGLDPSFDESV
jgi:hypothetical protein